MTRILYGSDEIKASHEVKKRLSTMERDSTCLWCSLRWDYKQGRLKCPDKIRQYKELCIELGKKVGE